MRRQVLLSSAKPLQEDFAQKVLEYEAELGLAWSLDSLRSLLELYSQAIEFYESKGDPRHCFYQEKMRNLLEKQNSFLPKSYSTPNSPKTRDLSKHRQADQRIKQHEVDSSRLSREISLNLFNQDSLLSLKLKNRQSKQNSPKVKTCRNQFRKSKTFKFEAVSSESESDKSGGFGISIKNDAFESKLEDVMERFVFEKIQKSKEIRKKYKEEIGQVLKMQGGSLIEKIVEQMRIDMKEEIKKAEKQLETERKSEIIKIKQSLNNF